MNDLEPEKMILEIKGCEIHACNFWGLGELHFTYQGPVELRVFGKRQ